MAMTPPQSAPEPAATGGERPKESEAPPIWFFVGALLLLYGVIILGAGIYQFWHPPHTVLARDHASFWGGVALTIFGGGFTIGFWPRKKHQGDQAKGAGAGK